MIAIHLEPLDLASLLCSRVCHDVISPVGAIINGLEVLEDEKDEEMRGIAFGLIEKSARQASARLQFARLAFGAAGSAGASIDTGDAEAVARGFIEDERTKLTWNAPRVLLPKNRVKLMLNLLLIAAQAVPRGGEIVLDAKVTGETCDLTIRASGSYARMAHATPALLQGETETGIVDAHGIQPYYTALIAREAGMSIDVGTQDGAVYIHAGPISDKSVASIG